MKKAGITACPSSGCRSENVQSESARDTCGVVRMEDRQKVVLTARRDGGAAVAQWHVVLVVACRGIAPVSQEDAGSSPVRRFELLGIE